MIALVLFYENVRGRGVVAQQHRPDTLGTWGYMFARVILMLMAGMSV